jgi:hypothetical protein
MIRQWLQRNDPPGVREICERTSLSRSVARRVLERFDEYKHSEIVGLLIAQVEDTLFHDPIEDLPELADVMVATEAELEAAFEGTARGPGFCNKHWQLRKQILPDKYGVDWLSRVAPVPYHTTSPRGSVMCGSSQECSSSATLGICEQHLQ